MFSPLAALQPANRPARHSAQASQPEPAGQQTGQTGTQLLLCGSAMHGHHPIQRPGVGLPFFIPCTNHNRTLHSSPHLSKEQPWAQPSQALTAQWYLKTPPMMLQAPWPSLAWCLHTALQQPLAWQHAAQMRTTCCQEAAGAGAQGCRYTSHTRRHSWCMQPQHAHTSNYY